MWRRVLVCLQSYKINTRFENVMHQLYGKMSQCVVGSMPIQHQKRFNFHPFFDWKMAMTVCGLSKENEAMLSQEAHTHLPEERCFN